MRKSVKEKWVAALRSGEYKQATGVLKNKEGGYCCLGVLTDLAIKDGVVMEVKEPHDFPHEAEQNGEYYDEDLNYEDGYTFDGSYELTPDKVIDWAEFPDGEADPTVRVEDELTPAANRTLSHLNDSGKTFNEIADYIEKSL